MRSNLVRAMLASHGGPRINTLLRRHGPAALDRLLASMRPGELAALDDQAGALGAAQVGAVLIGDPAYPRTLAESPDAPSALFHLGPIELLGGPVLAVCGSNAPGDGELIAAHAAAQIAADTGMAVVSGDPGGIGGAAVLTAVRRGGVAGVVLAEPLRARSRAELGSVRNAGRLVVASQFPPGRPWSVDSAMACNATLAGLSTALVAVAAASTGGTLDAAQRALAAGKPVLAVGDTPGSRLLVDHGATPARDRIELAWWLDRLRSDHQALAGIRSAAG